MNLACGFDGNGKLNGYSWLPNLQRIPNFRFVTSLHFSEDPNFCFVTLGFSDNPDPISHSVKNTGLDHLAVLAASDDGDSEVMT